MDKSNQFASVRGMQEDGEGCALRVVHHMTTNVITETFTLKEFDFLDLDSFEGAEEDEELLEQVLQDDLTRDDLVESEEPTSQDSKAKKTAEECNRANIDIISQHIKQEEKQPERSTSGNHNITPPPTQPFLGNLNIPYIHCNNQAIISQLTATTSSGQRQRRT